MKTNSQHKAVKVAACWCSTAGKITAKLPINFLTFKPKVASKMQYFTSHF